MRRPDSGTGNKRLSRTAVTRISAFGVGRYRSALRSKAAGQSLGYIGSSVIILLAGTVTSPLLARSLTVPEFGAYSAVTSFVIFLSLFFEFGLFVPAARAAATSTPRGKKEVLGATLLVLIPVGILYVAIVFLLSFWFDGWFNVSAGDALRLVAPLTIVFPLQFLLLQIVQGMDRLNAFSVSSAAGAVLFACTLATAFALGTRFSLTWILVASFVTLLLSQLCLIATLGPKLGSGLRTRITALVHDARSYGFEIYVARVMSTGTYRSDVLMVAAVSGARSVAFYSLASAIATVVAFPGVALGAALFSRMTKLSAIPREWIVIVWIGAVIGTLGSAALGRPIVGVLFSAEYLPVAGLLVPLAMAEGLRSVTTLYTSFQAAHARGKELRKAATYLTVSNLVLNIGLIPMFGAAGAAWASFLALLVNYCAHVRYYRRSQARSVSGLDTGFVELT